MPKAGWFTKGNFRYLDTNEPFRGEPGKIVLGDNKVSYYEKETGRELIPMSTKEPEPPTAEQLFWGGKWC